MPRHRISSSNTATMETEPRIFPVTPLNNLLGPGPIPYPSPHFDMGTLPSASSNTLRMAIEGMNAFQTGYSPRNIDSSDVKMKSDGNKNFIGRCNTFK